ncbi:Bactericidal permeability-increasing protein, alpha/beta domain protein [Moelleriella libera RCEF 2490]|uniref:Bactericidal permeability-increasing protein, alpha/beta domain protein n=1 Tax=Moelleriella libera RCEF 2490 TaxID=1081109 RepID=A0A167Y487_9HYPO|nr:Bactericidal permeability-increasing protein, alpha/beta domain protein [Moelleriella libera RCEF 2490]
MACFGICGSDYDEAEREPLLPQYHDATSRETLLHEKLHTYQMLRAMSQGYMPSNQQTTILLRTLLSAVILNPTDSSSLSTSGRALIRTVKLWLNQFMDLLQHKNSQDQIQDFVWYLTKARFNINTTPVTRSITYSKARANVAAAVESLRTILSLVLLNKDFRIFLADAATIAKQVLRDTAIALGDASKDAGAKLDTSARDIEALKETDATEQPEQSIEDVKQTTTEVVQTAFEEVTQVGGESYNSLKEHMDDDSRQILVNRLKKAVGNLRQRPDYSESVSILSNVLQRYLQIYLSVGSDAVHTAEDVLRPNQQAHQAAHNFWLFVTSFGNKDHWQAVDKSFARFINNHKADANLQEFVGEFATLVQRMLSDPTFFDHAEDRISELRGKIDGLTSGPSLGDDATDVLSSLQRALRSVADDEDVHKLAATTLRLVHIISPAGEIENPELVDDLIHVFVPLMVQAIQYLPIPRLEISTPAIDLLLENLILQPGRTINQSSFLPYNLQISTRNDIDVTKARFGTRSTVTSLATIKIAGMSIAADDLGYWMRLHTGLLWMTDAGIASFHLDERGIDITFDIEIGKERLEELVTLRGVNVKIHHLDYRLRKSKLACLAWILKPLIRPIIRKTLESQISSAIEDGMRALNRELVYARERLRATRICNPNDVLTFIRAVVARLVPPPDPDIQTRIGVKPGEGVFKGRYAPGSLVKLWEEEGRDAEQNVFEYKQDGWRNGIFDVSTVPATL